MVSAKTLLLLLTGDCLDKLFKQTACTVTVVFNHAQQKSIGKWLTYNSSISLDKVVLVVDELKDK